MSSGRKSIRLYYSKIAPRTILTCAIFGSCCELQPEATCPHIATISPCAISWLRRSRLPAPELAARRPTTGRPATRTLVLVAEDQPALLQIVRRHLDRHPIACQRLDPVLFHLAGGVGDDFVSGIELHAVAGIGEDFGHQSFELDQLFFSHGYLQIDRRLAWSLGAVGFGIRTAFAMQKSDPLHPFSLAAGLRRRARRLLPVGLVPVGLRNAIITTGTAVTARPFRARRGFIAPRRVHARSGSCASMLRRRRRRVAMTRRAAVFPRQRNADQFFDVAQICHFLRDRKST